jgi:hypothetical protein
VPGQGGRQIADICGSVGNFPERPGFMACPVQSMTVEAEAIFGGRPKVDAGDFIMPFLVSNPAAVANGKAVALPISTSLIAWSKGNTMSHQNFAPVPASEATGKRPLSKKKRFLIPTGVLLLGIMMGSCSGGTKPAADSSPAASTASSASRPR